MNSDTIIEDIIYRFGGNRKQALRKNILKLLEIRDQEAELEIKNFRNFIERKVEIKTVENMKISSAVDSSSGDKIELVTIQSIMNKSISDYNKCMEIIRYAFEVEKNIKISSIPTEIKDQFFTIVDVNKNLDFSKDGKSIIIKIQRDRRKCPRCKRMTSQKLKYIIGFGKVWYCEKCKNYLYDSD